MCLQRSQCQILQLLMIRGLKVLSPTYGCRSQGPGLLVRYINPEPIKQHLQNRVYYSITSNPNQLHPICSLLKLFDQYVVFKYPVTRGNLLSFYLNQPLSHRHLIQPSPFDDLMSKRLPLHYLCRLCWLLFQIRLLLL